MSTTYVRTRGGEMVHRTGCGFVTRKTKATPWNWAEGMTTAQIARYFREIHVRVQFCRACCPEMHA